MPPHDRGRMIEADVAIVGGGIHGCSTALHLARRGVRVVVIERDHVGRHASSANAGGVRTLLRHPAEIPLSLEADAFWHRIEAELGHDCGYHGAGQLAVALNDTTLAELVGRERQVRNLGYEHEELVDADEVRRLVPDICMQVKGGLIVRRDGAASPFHATRAFHDAAIAAGARMLEGCEVTDIEPAPANGWIVTHRHGRVKAASLVNNAGAWGDRIAAMVGDSIPLLTYLPMMMVTTRVAPFLEPVIISSDPRLSFKQMPNGTLLIGGGRRASGDRGERRYSLDLPGLSASASSVLTLFPKLRDVTIARAWAGFEGLFADRIPVIGPSPNAPGVFHAFGFSGHGFQLSPIVGRLVSELVLDGRSSLPIDAFSPTRFDNRA